MLQAGAPAPDFRLTDQNGNDLASADLAGGWYLLYWYPKADTPGCTAQAEGLRDQIDAFIEHGCTVLGASFDEPADNRAFSEKYQIPFRLLSDPDRTTAIAFGAADDTETSHARRIAHLVGPDGVVARAYDVTDPGFFADAVLDDLDDLTG
jgi:peroxiredoxin Q/BCP